MLLTREEQIDTLHGAARRAGVRIDKSDIDWRDGFFESGGLKLHYLDWGTEGKQPLLLLHGGMQTAHTWDLIAVAMKRDFHVVAMDLRGHGDSEWASDGDYGHGAHARDIGALLDHLGWGRLVLMGLSMGGLGALHFATKDSGRLDALVIVDVGPELNPSGVGRIVDFGQGPSELDSIDEFVRRALFFNPRRRPEQLRYSLTHNLRRLPNGKLTWKYDRRMRRRPQAGEESRRTTFSEMWERLQRIECPALVVRGGESDVLPEATAERMVATMPNSRHVTVPRAGHTVPQDNPRGFLEVVRSFLDEQSLP